MTKSMSASALAIKRKHGFATKRQPRNQMVRDLTWKRDSKGLTVSLCQSCKKEIITIKNWSFGHIVSDKNNGAYSVQNGWACCAHCNSATGERNAREWAKENHPDTYDMKITKTSILDVLNKQVKQVDYKYSVKYTYNKYDRVKNTPLYKYYAAAFDATVDACV
jgi:hypothetical protein